MVGALALPNNSKMILPNRDQSIYAIHISNTYTMEMTRSDSRGCCWCPMRHRITGGGRSGGCAPRRALPRARISMAMLVAESPCT